MRINGFIYFMTPALIWGSTWYTIKFQIGVTDPLWSVGFRFAIAAFILLAYCWLSGRKLGFPLSGHKYIILQGLTLFGVNYWMIYLAELHLTSALVAVIFSTLVFANILLSRLILKMPLQRKVVLGSILGFSGVVMLFKDEVTFSFTDQSFLAMLLCVGSVLLASTGNMISVANQKRKIPLVQNNAFGMLYGALSMFAVALITGKSFVFDTSVPYLLSLGYLAVFGSVLAFSAYLQLIQNIGPDKGGYVSTLIPVVALTISTFLEDHVWTIAGIFGTVLIVVGNLMAVVKIRSPKHPVREDMVR